MRARSRVRCRARGPGGSVLSRSDRSGAAVQPGLATVCRLGKAEAQRQSAAGRSGFYLGRWPRPPTPSPPPHSCCSSCSSSRLVHAAPRFSPPSGSPLLPPGNFLNAPRQRPGSARASSAALNTPPRTQQSWAAPRTEPR